MGSIATGNMVPARIHTCAHGSQSWTDPHLHRGSLGGALCRCADVWMPCQEPSVLRCPLSIKMDFREGHGMVCGQGGP